MMTERERYLRKKYDELKDVREFLKSKHAEAKKKGDPDEEKYWLAGYCVEKQMFRIHKMLD